MATSKLRLQRRCRADRTDAPFGARKAAAEREQLIAISDLINAFPKLNGRLAYGSAEASPSAVIDSIKNGLVPRVDDAVTRIEGAVREAIQQQHQSVHTLLQDLSASQTERTDRAAAARICGGWWTAEAQISEAIKDFSGKLDAILAELKDRTTTLASAAPWRASGTNPARCSQGEAQLELVRLALGGRRRSEGLAAGRVHAAFVQKQHAERWGPFFGLQPVPHTYISAALFLERRNST